MLNDLKIDRIFPDKILSEREIFQNSQLLKAYSPSFYCGKAIVFKSGEYDSSEYIEGHNDWTQWIHDSHETYHLSGKHSLLFEEQYVHEIALVLNREIK